MASALAAWDDDGPCTAIGHARPMSAAGAAFVNGTAVHGEDFDDTFEGGPVHAGAVVVPAVLAACERYGRDGSAALLGIAVGVETLCRLSLVTPKKVHKAGFHPTAVLGAVGAAAGVGAALRLDQRQLANALGNVGSMASGIIEYLAEGAWTKRFHPGWAAQSGLRAALLGRAGFVGPRTVFEGIHGLFNGFAHTQEGNYAALTGDFGERWVTETLAFKPYPCGTMTHPYIDCARRLRARGIVPETIEDLVCEVGGGDGASAVGAARRQAPPAQRLCGQVLDALLPRRRASCTATSASTRSPRMRCAIRPCSRVAAKVRYEIDPDNPYPDNYTGHIRASCATGRSSRSASRTCAAAATSRSAAAISRRNSSSTRGMADGAQSASSGRSRSHEFCLPGRSIWRRFAGDGAMSAGKELAGPGRARHRGGPQHRPRHRAGACGGRRRRRGQCALQHGGGRERRRARSRRRAAQALPVTGDVADAAAVDGMVAAAVGAVLPHRLPGQQRGHARREADRRDDLCGVAPGPRRSRSTARSTA